MSSQPARTHRHTGRLQPSWLPGLLAGLAAAATVCFGGSGLAAGAPGACPTVNRPNMLRVTAGSPQTAQLEKSFQTNLQVTLANSNGCPLTGQLGGIWVDFGAPASGASGTFAASGTNRATVGTDGTGVATAPTFTANDVTGSYGVRVDSDFGSVMLYLTNTASGVAASIAAIGPTGQMAAVNRQYQQPLKVQVLDSNGRPVQGTVVTFSLGTGSTGASASFLGGAAQATVTTKANGQATSPPFVANATPGRFSATASATDVPTVETFTLANRASADTITAVAPSELTAPVERHYPRPLQARVLDGSGRPIEGASVTFTLPSTAGGAGASFPGGAAQATRVTDRGGRASSPRLVANGIVGRFTATATVTGIAKSASYFLLNVAGTPMSISAGAASGQGAPVGARFPIPLAVTVSDANDNPVAGALVTFAAPARGPSGRFESRGGPSARRAVRVKTNDNGIAIAPVFTANRKAGGYIVTVRVASRLRAAIALVNRAAR